eukprot:TRINITY_DN11674_c0_g1_i2.p2 TRINITY_DN11674_c0_g1~~TRINITY_DN11674_c0_g1_i2.p2  ORF type:complete len:143 (+),score=34.96 TRINITY_DN11674_c0_g1_i2:508-936(+)
MLEPVECLLHPVAALLPAGDPPAKPLVPAAYQNLETLRQRLLRAVTDGCLDRVIKSTQSSLRKRGARVWPEEVPPASEPPPPHPELPAALRTYFSSREDGTAAAESMFAAPETLRGDRLRALLNLEAVVQDVCRQYVSAVSM